MALLGEFFQLQVTISAFPLQVLPEIFFGCGDYIMVKLQGSPEPLAGFKMKCPFVCTETCNGSYSFLVSQYAISAVLRDCCFLFGNYSIVYLLLEEQRDRYVYIDIEREIYTQTHTYTYTC